MDKRPTRSCAVTLAAFGVFLFATGSLLQAGLALAQYDQLRNLPLSAPAWYFLLGGIVWGVLGLGAGMGIWRRQAWGFRLAMVTVVLQFVAWLADSTLIHHPAAVMQSFGFDLALRFLLVVIGTAILVRLGCSTSGSHPG